MKIGRLISLVKERPVLYNSQHPLNKDRKEKEQMWKEISTLMNIHSDIAKSRWKSLKDCYTKHLKSITSTGPSSYLKYVHWQWADHMEFIKPYIKYGLIITNFELRQSQESSDLGTQSSSDAHVYQSNSEVVAAHKNSRTPERFETPERIETSERSETPEKSDTPERSETPIKAGKHERLSIHERSEMHGRSRTHERPESPDRSCGNKVKRRRYDINVSPNVNTAPNNDRITQYLENKKAHNFSATELIFLGYAKSIKSFSIRRQAQVKMKIAKIMMQEEIAHFEEIMS